MKKIIVSLLRFYRKHLSSLKGRPSCRYYPSCSRYALDAIEEWGTLIGMVLTIWRLLRCNPLSRGGVDFVPKNKRKRREMLIPRVRRRYSGAGDSFGLLYLYEETKQTHPVSGKKETENQCLKSYL